MRGSLLPLPAKPTLSVRTRRRSRRRLCYRKKSGRSAGGQRRSQPAAVAAPPAPPWVKGRRLGRARTTRGSPFLPAACGHRGGGKCPVMALLRLFWGPFSVPFPEGPPLARVFPRAEADRGKGLPPQLAFLKGPACCGVSLVRGRAAARPHPASAPRRRRPLEQTSRPRPGPASAGGDLLAHYRPPWLGRASSGMGMMLENWEREREREGGKARSSPGSRGRSLPCQGGREKK